MKDGEFGSARSVSSAAGGRSAQRGGAPRLAGSGALSLRRAARLSALFAFLTAALCSLPPSAMAVDTGHSYSFSFKASGQAAFSEYISGIAVDNSSGPSSGDVYVIDVYNYRVDKFDSEGNFILMFGDGVNQTTGGDVCTAASGDTCKAGTWGSSAQQFQSPMYLAVDGSSGPSAGDVYVADTFQKKVHKYDENGNLITSWGSGGVQSGAGIEGGPFFRILGIDVDSSGQLLVSWASSYESSEQTKVAKFAQDGTFASQIKTAAGDQGEMFAWAPGYVFRERGYRLRRSKDSDGSETRTITASPVEPCFNGTECFYPWKIAADHSTGTVYETLNYESRHRVWEFKFDGSGQPLDSAGNPCAVTLTETGEGCPPTHQFGQGYITYAGSLAVASATDRVYVIDSSKRRVVVFVGAPAPVAETGEPTGRITVSGTAKLDGAGDIAECYFEFGDTTEYGSKQPCSPAAPYSSDQAVTAELPGLVGDGEHTYHYRLVATNESKATSLGADKTITPHNVEGLETLAAESIGRTTAKLRGTFEGNGEDTHYYFEWGTSPKNYTATSATPPGPVVSAPSGPTEVSAEPTLAPQTKYYYRVVAENGIGKTFGREKTFETLPAVQSLTTLGATNVTRRTATLNASYEGDGAATEFKFEWGVGPNALSHSTPPTSTGNPAPTGATHLEVALTGCGASGTEAGECLEYQKTYYFRVSATNGLGTTRGSVLSFETKPAVAGVVTLPVGTVTQESVPLNGEFEGNGEETSWYFEYGPSTEYGRKTTTMDGGSPAAPPATPVQFDLTEFEGFTTYHYRLVAENAVGRTAGADLTFTTLPALLPEVSGATASDLAPNGATLSALVNPNRWPTVYAFDYGTSSAYEASTLLSDVIDGNGNSNVPVDVEISGLEPGTTYHYRIVAINIVGTAHGTDQTFTTPGLPQIQSTSSSAVGQTTAHLSGTVTPNSSSTTFHFEYGSGAGYEASSAESGSIGADTAVHSVGADLSGLAPNTTYHFRLVATNAVGRAVSSDGIFTTATAPTSSGEEPKPKPKRCRKGFVKRGGRCVKRRHPHKGKHRHHRGGRNG